MRLDLLLYRLRLAKSRTLAQRRIAEGHMRVNGQRVLRQTCAVATGDVLTLMLGNRVAVLEILDLPERRGPAPEAQACYRVLDAGRAIAIAGREGAGAPGTNEGTIDP